MTLGLLSPYLFDIDPAPDWEALGALCRHWDTEDWFPVRAHDGEVPIEVCLLCPAREQCLDYAVTNKIEFGIWGGVSQEPRSKRRAKR